MTDEALPPPRAAGVIKHSLMIQGHRTSISLEDAFWRQLRAEAASRGVSLAGLVAEIDAARDGANLSSAIRVWILENALAQASRGGKAEKAAEFGQ